MTSVEASLQYFTEYAKEKSNAIGMPESRVEFVVAFMERALLSGSQHVYDDPYLFCQLISGAQGACFMHVDDLKQGDLDGLVGNPVLDVIDKVPDYIAVALLDAYFSLLNIYENLEPTERVEFKGSGSDKSRQRAKTIAQLAGVKANDRVLLIGAIADLMDAVVSVGAELKVADLALAGSSMIGIPIMYDAIPLLDWANVVIMTGNTLKTNTLSNLLFLLRNSGARILVYAMSGANVAPHYLKHGVHTVTAEYFPFYWYANMTSRMHIYRA